MFEDEQVPKGGQQGGPHDIFADLDKTAPPAPTGAGERQSALESGLIRPVEMPGVEPKPQAPAGAGIDTDLPEISEPIISKWKWIILIVLVVLIIAGGAYIFYKKITGAGGAVKPSAKKAAQEEKRARPPEEDATAAVSQEDEDDIIAPKAPVLPQTPQDSDQDGLTDKEEGEFGTDPQSPDTDKDGLTDKEEVLLWRTDPKNSDTDGDSYLDGEEVSHGYRPDGPGKLFE